ncbi:MAG TPA: pitrilysin family protein, partial [bacterium]|nr:pitrilysin family protein [bacterium]
TVSRDQLDPALQIMHEILTDVVFPEHELQRARGQMKADCKKKLDMPGVILGELFQSTLFGSHPYGRGTDGEESVVDDLSRDDVVRFYNETLTACGAIVTVVGDVDEKKIITFIEKNWASHFQNSINADTVLIDKPRSLERRFFTLTDRPIAQAHIALGHTGPARGEPGHVPQMVLNYILGGAGLSSRLTHHIRTQQGLAYSVYSSLTKRKFGGMFSVVLQTSAAHAPRAVTAIVKELEAIKADGVSDQELEDAKLYFSGHHPFTMETIERMALLIEQGAFFDLPPDYVERELAELQSLEQDDLRKAADMIDPKHWVLAIIGNEALIRPPIQKLLHHYERQ